MISVPKLSLIFLSCASIVAAQERPLTLQEVRDIPGVYSNPTFPAKCGSNGYIYLRFFNGSTSMPASRVDPEMKTVKQFPLDGTEYSGHSHIWDFAPTPDGGVAQLVWYKFQDKTGYRILRFDSDGKLQSDNSVDVPFDPMQIAALGNGSFVVAGRRSTELGGHKGAPGIAVVNDRGQLVKELTISRDVKPPEKTGQQKTSKPNDPPSDAQTEYDYALDLTTAETGDDGNVYVLRPSATGPLFVITPAATVKGISLPSIKDATINAFVVARGKAMVHYVSRSDNYRESDLGLYALVDLRGSDPVVDYRVETGPLSSNNMPGCYDGNEISFLKIAPKGKLSVLTAKPE